MAATIKMDGDNVSLECECFERAIPFPTLSSAEDFQEAHNALSHDPHPLTFQRLHRVSKDCFSAWRAGSTISSEARRISGLVLNLRYLKDEKPEYRAPLVSLLEHRLAKVVIAADLLATKYGIDLASAVIDEVNGASIEKGLGQKL